VRTTAEAPVVQRLYLALFALLKLLVLFAASGPVHVAGQITNRILRWRAGPRPAGGD